MMHALVLAHAEAKRVSVRDIFRAAYMYAFEKDAPPRSLEDDLEAFHKTGNSPPYVIRYFLELFGSKS